MRALRNGLRIGVMAGIMLASGMALAGEDPDSSAIARDWASPRMQPVYTKAKIEASAKTTETDASVVATSPEAPKTASSMTGRRPLVWSAPESLH
jgi:hypothetical protein